MLFIQIGPSGQVRADLQHPQVVVKIRHVEVGRGDPGGLQGGHPLDVHLGIGRRQHQLRLRRKQCLQAQLLGMAQVHSIGSQGQVKILPGVIGGGADLAAGEDPDVGKAAQKTSHPLGAVHGHGPAQIVGEGVPGLLRSRPTAKEQGAGQK